MLILGELYQVNDEVANSPESSATVIVRIDRSLKANHSRKAVSCKRLDISLDMMLHLPGVWSLVSQEWRRTKKRALNKTLQT